MIDRILLIMPTRGRPWQAIEAIVSVLKNAAQPSMVLIVACRDADDFSHCHHGSLKCQSLAVLTSERMRFVQWVNVATQRFIGQFEWVGWLADDIRYLTPGWDNLVREHKELVVYGDDGYQHEKMATHPFIRSEIPRALGYLLPSELTHLCPDTFIEALAREISSIAYDPRIKTEHLHPDAGKGVDDQTYRDASEHHAKDRETFATVIRPRIPALAEQVTEFISSHANAS